MKCLVTIHLLGRASLIITRRLLTFSSSGPSLNASVCGTVWPSDQSSSWPCGSVRVPHGSPSFSSSRGGPGGSHAACGATLYARSGAVRGKYVNDLQAIIWWNYCLMCLK